MALPLAKGITTSKTGLINVRLTNRNSSVSSVCSQSIREAFAQYTISERTG